jgi:hypothetical protein
MNASSVQCLSQDLAMVKKKRTAQAISFLQRAIDTPHTYQIMPPLIVKIKQRSKEPCIQ